MSDTDTGSVQTGTEAAGQAVETAGQEGGALVATPWDGEFEHLEEQDFFKVLPEEHREGFKSGYKAKLDNLTRGFHGKMQELTTKEKKLLEDVKQREEAVRRMMYGEDDPTKPLNERIAVLEREAGEWKQKFEDLSSSMKQRVVDAIVSDLQKNHPEVYENEKAYEDYCTLIGAGVDPAKAVLMVKATIASEEKVEPRKAEAAMSGDDGGSRAVVAAGSWDEAVRRYAGS